MKSVQISLKMASSVKDFVNVVSKYPYDIDLRNGRYVVDAKSILGIFSLDLRQPIKLTYNSEEGADKLYEQLKPFIVE